MILSHKKYDDKIEYKDQFSNCNSNSFYWKRVKSEKGSDFSSTLISY